jgi:hypothetical protein
MSKIALLIGINYTGTKSQLSGCINDITNTKDILKNVYKYEEKNIIVLTDDTLIKPTANNIIMQLYNLAFRTKKENIKEIWISYSGHGSYIKDTNRDEGDSKDECLVPLDYEKNGLIADDMLNHILSFINPKTSVIFVADACHSGTMLDLPYRYISGNKNVIENKSNKIKSNVILISGCQDIETSADAYNINNSKLYSGAMTSALLETLKKFNYNINCWNLLKEMRLFLIQRKFTQIPQICSTTQIDETTLFVK